MSTSIIESIEVEGLPLALPSQIALVTLLDLIEIYGDLFVRVHAYLSEITDGLLFNEAGFPLRLLLPRRGKRDRAGIIADLKQIHHALEVCGLSLCVVQAAELIKDLEAGEKLSMHEFASLTTNLSLELKSFLFLGIPYKRREFFNAPLKDWESIVTVFPESRDDIEEMNKCFALSRYTAAIFHSLLVVEHGLIKLGHTIAVSDPKPGWDATYKQLGWLLNNRPSVPADLDFNFLEQTKARLDSMKLAWRNKVNHAAGKLMIERTGFTDFAAEEIIIACRSFMRHLAEGLPQ